MNYIVLCDCFNHGGTSPVSERIRRGCRAEHTRIRRKSHFSHLCTTKIGDTDTPHPRDTHLFDLQQPSRVLTLGPPTCRRRFVVGDGDDVAG